MIASRLLTKCGHQVTVAATGVAAIEAWQSREFDVVLMDNQMPEMDGVEAVRRIRLLEAAGGRTRTIIIALTASAMTGDRQRFLDAGMDGYLAKPFRAEELYEVLQTFGGPSQSQQHIIDLPVPLNPA
jgi:CheY-like chemotaxis protein